MNPNPAPSIEPDFIELREAQGLWARRSLSVIYAALTALMLAWCAAYIAKPCNFRLLSFAFCAAGLIVSLVSWRRFVEIVPIVAPLTAVIPVKLGYVNYSLTLLMLLGGLGGIFLRLAARPRVFRMRCPAGPLLFTLAGMGAISSLFFIYDCTGANIWNYMLLMKLGVTDSITFQQEQPVHTFGATLGLLEMAIYFLLALRLAQSGSGRRRLLRALAIGGALAAGIGMYQLIRWWAGMESFNVRFGLLRVCGPWHDPNGFASHLTLAIFALPAWLADAPRRRWLYCAPLIAAMLFVIFATGSRIAYAGIIAGLLAWIAMHRLNCADRAMRLYRHRRMLFAAAALIASGAILLLAYRVEPHNPDSLKWMLSHGAEQTPLTARLNIWRRALLLFALDPWTGIGSGQLYSMLDRYYQPGSVISRMFNPIHENAHNQFLQYMTELGVFGFAVFLLLNLYAGLRGSYGALCAKGAARNRMAWLTAAWLGFIITLLSGHALIHREMLLLYAALLALLYAPLPDAAALLTSDPRLSRWRWFFVCGALCVYAALHIFSKSNANYRTEFIATGLYGPESDRSGDYVWSSPRSMIFLKKTTPYFCLQLACERARLQNPMPMTIRYAGLTRYFVLTDPYWHWLNFKLPPEKIGERMMLSLEFDQFWRSADVDPGSTDQRALTMTLYNLIADLNIDAPIQPPVPERYVVRTAEGVKIADAPEELQGLPEEVRRMIEEYIPRPKYGFNRYAEFIGLSGRRLDESNFMLYYVIRVKQKPPMPLTINLIGRVRDEHVALLPPGRREKKSAAFFLSPDPPGTQWETGDFVVLQRKVSASPIPYELRTGFSEKTFDAAGDAQYKAVDYSLELGWIDFSTFPVE
ncbi:O-antigen ligase family protein [Candidatus Sumerlaeota bacterium]|nr:O-antigen ligase family protein [Candidatus Sumerlaeota bacterium]